MDAQLKAKWIEALRSGDYQQGMNYLRSNDGFCCLGVLCDISGDGIWISDPECEGLHKYTLAGKLSGNRATLPIEISKKYGIYDFSPLISMNDSGRSFAEIASYIEANL